MTQPKERLSPRKEWDELVEGAQEHVNVVLDEFQREIDETNRIIRSTIAHDRDGALLLANNLVENLNERWPFHDDIFFVTGAWFAPAAKVSDSSMTVMHQDADAFEFAKSKGFSVYIDDDTDETMNQFVGMSFEYSTMTFKSALGSGELSLYAHAFPGSISALFVRPGHEMSFLETTEEVLEAIERANALLNMYLNHKDSSFYQQSATKQGHFLRGVLDSINDVMPAPDSLESRYLMDAVTRSFFVYDSHKRAVTYYSSGDNDPFEITGAVKGVSLIDLIEDGPGIKYNEGMIAAAEHGVSLVVEARSSNIDLDRFEGKDLLVPVSSIFNFSDAFR